MILISRYVSNSKRYYVNVILTCLALKIFTTEHQPTQIVRFSMHKRTIVASYNYAACMYDKTKYLMLEI